MYLKNYYKTNSLNVLVLNNTGYGHLCLGEITEGGDGNNIRDVTLFIEGCSYSAAKPNMYGSNSIDIVSIASIDDVYSNKTCNMKHGALSGQVSILSCITGQGKPDSSLDMGDSCSFVTNTSVLLGNRYNTGTSIMYDGHLNEPHGPNI